MSLAVQVHRIVKERKGQGEYIPSHTHPFFHCVYIIGGRGRVQIGEQTVDARRGLFLRIAPHVKHAIFGEDAMQSFDIKFSAQGSFLTQLNELPLAMPLDSYEQALIMDVFHLAVRGEAYAEALINTRMTELLLLLLRRETRVSASYTAPLNGSHAALYPALAYIEQHPDQMPPVSFLAELCGYTPSYFSTAFKQTFGCSPARYLHGKKVELARERMLTTDCTVSELADQAGMDPASFSRMFKKVTGISPSQYLHRVNSDVGINISPDSPYLPSGAFEIPKQG
nr:AraC family transcriptional regulator [uncultured Dysosmobacter sp.]